MVDPFRASEFLVQLIDDSIASSRAVAQFQDARGELVDEQRLSGCVFTKYDDMAWLRPDGFWKVCGGLNVPEPRNVVLKT